ncbi:hypothetical protein HALO113_120036 [Halomonas sp. 113]|nr:hypothetical protein HALO113_120036 [Halomonas sp. 113]CAD5297093.1 hypothetical protein HALO156_90226 [Halomonas sp. 156]
MPLSRSLSGISLLVLVLGFGEGDLIHGSTESYAVDDSRIITDGSDFFRASLSINGIHY